MRKYILSVLLAILASGFIAWLVVSTMVIRSWEDSQKVAHIAIVIVKQYSGIFGLRGDLGVDGYRVFVGSVANLTGLLAAAVVGLAIGLAVSILQYVKLHKRAIQ